MQHLVRTLVLANHLALERPFPSQTRDIHSILSMTANCPEHRVQNREQGSLQISPNPHSSFNENRIVANDNSTNESEIYPSILDNIADIDILLSPNVVQNQDLSATSKANVNILGDWPIPEELQVVGGLYDSNLITSESEYTLAAYALEKSISPKELMFVFSNELLRHSYPVCPSHQTQKVISTFISSFADVEIWERRLAFANAFVDHRLYQKALEQLTEGLFKSLAIWEIQPQITALSKS